MELLIDEIKKPMPAHTDVQTPAVSPIEKERIETRIGAGKGSDEPLRAKEAKAHQGSSLSVGLGEEQPTESELLFDVVVRVLRSI